MKLGGIFTLLFLVFGLVTVSPRVLADTPSTTKKLKIFSELRKKYRTDFQRFLKAKKYCFLNSEKPGKIEITCDGVSFPGGMDMPMTTIHERQADKIYQVSRESNETHREKYDMLLFAL